MKNRLRELVTGLINVAFYYIPKVTMQGEQGQQPATSAAEDDSQGIIKRLLLKFYDFSFLQSTQRDSII